MPNIIKDEEGEGIKDEEGNYILDETATWSGRSQLNNMRRLLRFARRK